MLTLLSIRPPLDLQRMNGLSAIGCGYFDEKESSWISISLKQRVRMGYDQGSKIIPVNLLHDHKKVGGDIEGVLLDTEIEGICNLQRRSLGPQLHVSVDGGSPNPHIGATLHGKRGGINEHPIISHEATMMHFVRLRRAETLYFTEVEAHSALLILA